MRKRDRVELGCLALALLLVFGSVQGVAQTPPPAGTPPDEQPGRVTEPPGMMIEPPGQVTETPGQVTETPGQVTAPPGRVTETPGAQTLPPGTRRQPPGTVGQPRGTQGQPRGTQGQQPPAGTEQWQAITELREQVFRLQQEVERLRNQLQTSGTGVGGAGREGQDPVLDDPTRVPGVGRRGVIGTIPEDPSPGRLEVSTLFTGEVDSLANGRLVLRDAEGETTTLPLSPEVQVFREGQRVPVEQLEEGARVRARSDLNQPGVEVTEIEILALPEQRDEAR